MKRIAIVPTLLTLGNCICGFVSVTFASKVMPGARAEDVDFCFSMAGWFILAAMVFDMLDGHVARLSKTASKFGAELDSLCDAITFGFAGAFLILKMGPGWERAFLHQLLAGIAALYLVCTLLRLARFNVEAASEAPGPKRFRGLPSPGAAGCIASLAILRGELPARLTQYLGEGPSLDAALHGLQIGMEIVAPVGGLVVALLMVSTVPYPHLTSRILRGKRPVGHLVQVLMAGFILLMLRQVALALVFWGYALLFPLRARFVASMRPELEAPRLDDVPHSPT